jgi:thiamine pyrophosphokinase
MIALIIANGPLPRRSIINKLVASADLIVCADGGANHARAQRITPDVILGDLDSITSATREFFARVPALFIEDQYSTDLEKAIAFCIRRKAATAEIIGALGERIDHATGSLGCFKKFRNRIRLRFHDGHGVLTLIDKRLSMTARKGQKLSLIPVGRCTGITTSNLKYELKNAALELGVREGISNEATSAHVSITVRTGTLLLYQFH